MSAQYRLRVYVDEQLMITTICDTPEEAGRRLAEAWDQYDTIPQDGDHFPTQSRWTLHTVEDGLEREATPEESNAAFSAMNAREDEFSRSRAALCPRCGRIGVDHDVPGPVILGPSGPIPYECWTDDERAALRDGTPMPPTD